MPKDCHGLGVDELVIRLTSRVDEEKVRIDRALQATAVENYARLMAKKLQDSLVQDTDDWKLLIPGRPLFNIFAERSRLGAARLKTAFLKLADSQPVNPFQEVIDIFSSFNNT